MKLTDFICRTVKSNGKIKRLFDGAGLYLEISAEGNRKYWRMKYRFEGRERRLSLGIYDEVSLNMAREKVYTARKTLEGGIDPSVQKKEIKSLTGYIKLNTFEAMARSWHDYHKVRWGEVTAHNNIYRLEKDIFPVLGKYPVDTITIPQIAGAIRKIEERGASEVARRILGLCNQVFRYCVVQGILTRNPLADIRPMDMLRPAKKGHFASIDTRELPALIRAIHSDEYHFFPVTRIAVEMMLLTFVRTGELIKAEWTEVDLENRLWVIPAERMKMRQAHIVPLSDRVMELLTTLKTHTGHRRYLFPHYCSPRKHMSSGTILRFLETIGYKGKMTGHGFRSLAMSTIKEELGYRHEVVDRQLAHAPRSKIDAAYDRAKFLNERRKMMQEWGEYVDKIRN